jgi:hypothetical protein
MRTAPAPPPAGIIALRRSLSGRGGNSCAQKVFERPIGPGLETSKTGQGYRHNIVVRGLSKLLGPAAQKGQLAPGDYQVTAYFPADLGGDTFEGTLSIGAA